MSKLNLRSGPFLRKVLDKDEFHGVKLDGQLPDNFQATTDKLVDSVVDCITARCSNIHEGIFGATKIADFSTWPMQNDGSKFLFSKNI